jgi:hypothetical protein
MTQLATHVDDAPDPGPASREGSEAHPTPLMTPLLRLAEEGTLTSTQAANLLGVNVASITRWIEQGLRGVKLEGARVGSRLFTSRAALDRFSFALAAERAGRQDQAQAQ